MARKKKLEGSTAQAPAPIRYRKKTFVLDVETIRKLGAFACHEDSTESKVVIDALEKHMADYRSYRKGGKADEPEKPTVRLADSTAEPAAESA